MKQGFTFDHDGRTYECTVERRTAAPAGWWWWFAVSRDQQRYAPFEMADGDKEASVKARIIAYYENLLEVRARPPEPRHHFSRPGRPKSVPAADAAEL
ncbi:MAG: hypothetical protein NTZ43_02390 [Gemmatimonadetes bacterium]|nr:hypothetical protein [Gemmatimonadota bacterium]